MHFSGSNSRKFLSAAILGALGLAIVPSLAQNVKPVVRPHGLGGGIGISPIGDGGGGGIGISPIGGGQPGVGPAPIPRFKLPPHPPLRTPAAIASYATKMRQVQFPPRTAKLRDAMKHIAQMAPFGGDGSGGSGPHALRAGHNTGGKAGNGALQSLLAPPAAFNPLAIYIPPVTPPTVTPVWTNVGPFPLQPFAQTYFGPSVVTGRINSLVFDPTDSNTEYIAAPVGGIWKTTNAGVTWTPITESLSTQSFSSITIDPTNHNILYAGSGDYDGGDETGGGLFRSMDAGATWTNLDPDGTIFADHSLRAVLIDPRNPNIVMVAIGRGIDGETTSDGGILRTTNALMSNTPTFTPVLAPDGDCRNLVYNANQSIVYAAVESFDTLINFLFFGVFPGDAGIYSSTDNGLTWTQVMPTIDYVDVATSQVNTAAGRATAYAADGETDQVFKSTNGGTTWTDITNNFPQALNPQDGSDGVWDQSFYDFYIATAQRPGNLPGDITNPVDVVYVGLKDVYQSTDAGLTWGAVGQVSVAPVFTFNDQMHTDQHGIGIDPNNNNNVLMGNDGGVYRLNYTPATSNYVITDLNASLCVTEFYQTVFHPTSANTILGGTQDNGTDYSFGSLNQFGGVTGGDGSGVAINALVPSTMYSCYPGSPMTINVNLTDDNWQTVTNISHNVGMENTPFVQVIALDPQNYDHLYAGSNNLWLYDHAAKSWTEILDENSVNKPLTGGVVTAIAPSGIPAQGFEPIVYVGCSSGEVYTYVPAADNPTTAYTVNKLITFRGSVSSITVSRVNARRIFVTTTAGEVYRCNDAINTNTFIDITGAGQVTDPTHLPVLLPVNTLAIGAQDDEQLLYVGTDLGVFASSDGGQNWYTYSVPFGLPNTKINSLDVNASTGFLSAGTFGRGIWRIPITNKVTIHFIPQWQSYRGSKNGVPVLVEVRKPGTPNTSIPVETQTVYSNNAGAFDVNLNSRGHYDIYITVPRFLRKKFANVLTTTQPTLAPLLYIGDVDRDNAVTQADLAAIRQSLGLFTTGLVDVDGDGRVTSNDYNIAAQNLGRRGD